MDIDTLQLVTVAPPLNFPPETFTRASAEESFMESANSHLIFACVGSGLFFVLIIACCVRWIFNRRRNICDAIHVIRFRPVVEYEMPIARPRNTHSTYSGLLRRNLPQPDNHSSDDNGWYERIDCDRPIRASTHNDLNFETLVDDATPHASPVPASTSPVPPPMPPIHPMPPLKPFRGKDFIIHK